MEALLHASWEIPANREVAIELIPPILKRGWVVDREWMNHAIKEIIKNPTNEKVLRFAIQYTNPRIVKTENMLDLLDLSQIMQANFGADSSTVLRKDYKLRLESNFNRRKAELRHLMSQYKSADQRQAYEEDMSLYLE